MCSARSVEAPFRIWVCTQDWTVTDTLTHPLHSPCHNSKQTLPTLTFSILSTTQCETAQCQLKHNRELTATLELTQSGITDTCSTTLCRQSLCTTTLPVNHLDLFCPLSVAGTWQMPIFLLTNFFEIYAFSSLHYPHLPDGCSWQV